MAAQWTLLDGGPDPHSEGKGSNELENILPTVDPKIAEGRDFKFCMQIQG